MCEEIIINILQDIKLYNENITDVSPAIATYLLQREVTAVEGLDVLLEYSPFHQGGDKNMLLLFLFL